MKKKITDEANKLKKSYEKLISKIFNDDQPTGKRFKYLYQEKAYGDKVIAFKKKYKDYYEDEDYKEIIDSVKDKNELMDYCRTCIYRY